LAVRNLVGYNECSPLIRSIEEQKIVDRFFKRFDNRALLCTALQPLLDSERVKDFWDDLVRPISILNGSHLGILESSCFHGYHSFRFRKDSTEEPFIDFFFNWSSVFNCFNYSHVSDRELLTWNNGFFFCSWTDLTYEEGQNKIIKYRDFPDIVGVPVKCSYSTPAVLYNLFVIFVKISKIKNINGLYYKEVTDSFFKPLGTEQWFKNNYFEVVDLLLTWFGPFVLGIDYYRLFSLQIDNVIGLMKIKPLDGGSWPLTLNSEGYSELKTYVSS
jgi:hypothetical protein